MIIGREEKNADVYVVLERERWVYKFVLINRTTADMDKTWRCGTRDNFEETATVSIKKKK